MDAIYDELCRWFITAVQTRHTVVSAVHRDANVAHTASQRDASWIMCVCLMKRISVLTRDEVDKSSKRHSQRAPRLA